MPALHGSRGRSDIRSGLLRVRKEGHGRGSFRPLERSRTFAAEIISGCAERGGVAGGEVPAPPTPGGRGPAPPPRAPPPTTPPLTPRSLPLPPPRPPASFAIPVL